MGKKYSDGKFPEWWKKQPSYVSFESWLSQEEEKRKVGGSPCPTCGTLNPRGSTVCHKCGVDLARRLLPGGIGAGDQKRREEPPRPSRCAASSADRWRRRPLPRPRSSPRLTRISPLKDLNGKRTEAPASPFPFSPFSVL